MYLEYPDVLARIGVACVCGLIIGVEREWRGQPAGIRTHMVLAIGACLAMILGIEVAHAAPGNFSDPQRIPAQVISGVGFLGAGAILRFGMNVHGLTTATSLWTVSVIGLVCGNAWYEIALSATLILFVALTVLRRLWNLVFGYTEMKRLQIVAVHEPGLVRKLLAVFDAQKIWIDHLGIEHDIEANRLELTGHIRIGSLRVFDELMEQVCEVGEIRSCRIG